MDTMLSSKTQPGIIDDGVPRFLKQNIFISIASYMDPHLQRTIRSALDAAEDPARLSFGVVEQATRPTRDDLRGLCDRIAYVHLDPRDTLGACWARTLAHSLYNEEAYFCQIDAHSVFDPGWDRLAVEALDALAAQTGNPKTLISNLPTAFTLDPYGKVVDEPHGTPFKLIPNMQTFDPLVGALPGSKALCEDTDGPVAGLLVAAGFIFAPAPYVEDLPYDPLLYFNGEELAISLKAYTRGWDVWHMNPAPLRHLYKTKRRGESFLHWDSLYELKRRWTSTELIDRARRRLDNLIHGRIGGAYGLGEVRSAEVFWNEAGIRPIVAEAPQMSPLN
jgi:hypothetical protein